MFASFLITLREGLEAFLLVGICLSYLAKLGASRYNKFIYLGVGLGLVAVFGSREKGSSNEPFSICPHSPCCPGRPARRHSTKGPGPCL